MKQTFKTLTIALALTLSGMASAQNCYLEVEQRATAPDSSLQSKKQMWEACTDIKLAQLDPSRPNYMELGQEIGDTCVNSNVICQ
ncbi:hypothetical protein GW916_13860 [bacterium]|nr:hypothetical protein [bacterium]